jgi:hypothetical protein
LPGADFVIPDEVAPPRLRWIEPIGVAALLGAGAALLSALAPALCGLVVPASGVGLLAGLAGLLLVLARGRFHLLLPAAGSAVAGGVLLAALLAPSLLGPTYLASRGRDPVDPDAIRVVPLPGNRSDTAPADPEWVDASRCALQQGRTQVQVLSASVRPVKGKSSSAKNLPPGEYLFLRLRTLQVETAAAPAGQPSQPPGPRREQPRPRLTDSKGKAYPMRDFQELTEADERKSSGFPVAFQDEVLVFEAPSPGPEYLRLELAADAWGGKGAFRFTIPGSMIHSERAGQNGLAGGR